MLSSLVSDTGAPGAITLDSARTGVSTFAETVGSAAFSDEAAGSPAHLPKYSNLYFCVTSGYFT